MNNFPHSPNAAALLAGVCMAALLGVAPAHAQDAAPPAAEETVGGVEDIVVTARKRSESVQDIPVSVTAISAERIEQYDLTSLEKVAASTPQFTVGRASNGSGASLTLRGIGSSASSIGIEQSVAVVVDSIYYGQGRVINEGFFDLSRIEVLKGPQALFFGKNATAGVVSLTTADPSDEFELMARAGYEFSSENVTGEIVASGPISDTLGIRLALRGSKMYGGLFTNRARNRTFASFDVDTGTLDATGVAPAGQSDVPGEREMLGRLTLKWTPSGRLTNTLKVTGDINKNDNPSWNYVLFNCPSGFSQFDAANQCGRNFTIYQNDFPTQLQNLPFARSDGRLYNDYRSFAVTDLLNYELDDVTITSATNYNWNRNRFACDCDFQSGNAHTFATENTSWKAFSTELRVLTTFDGPFNVMAGGYYQSTKRKFDQWVNTAGVDNSAASISNRYVAFAKSSETEGETIAAFGQASWKITPELEAAVGVRYSHETKDSFFRHPYVNPAFASVFRPYVATVATSQIVGDQTFNNWSPEATLTWKPTDDVTAYAAYKTAYKSGGFSNSGIYSAFSPNPLEDFVFGSEKAEGFELGLKTTLLDNQLRFNVGAYSYKVSNLQVDYFNSVVFAFQTLNAGAATSRGIEVEFEYAPRALDGFSLHGTVNYNKARYKNFIAPCYSGQSQSEGCTLLVSGAPFQDLSGAPTAVAPRWTGTLGGSYETRLGGMILGLSADARYSSSYLANSFGNPAGRIASYVSIDGSVRLRSDNSRWELAVIGKNLTNRFYALGGGGTPSSGGAAGGLVAAHGDQVGFTAPPRTVQMQLTIRY